MVHSIHTVQVNGVSRNRGAQCKENQADECPDFSRLHEVMMTSNLSFLCLWRMTEHFLEPRIQQYQLVKIRAKFGVDSMMGSEFRRLARMPLRPRVLTRELADGAST
jgi:hypothetical protein